MLYYNLKGRETMPQSDGKNTLKRFELELRGPSGTNSIWYRFQVNPQSYKESFPQRSTVYRTRTSVVVEDYGRDLGQLEFSGTTGLKVDKEGKNGADRLKSLKKIIEDYSSAGHRVDDVEQTELELIFYNRTDGGSYYVHLAPEAIQIERSAEQSLLYNYRLAFIIIRNADDPDTRDVDEAVIGNGGTSDGYTYQTTSEAINPNSLIPVYGPSLGLIKDQINYGGNNNMGGNQEMR